MMDLLASIFSLSFNSILIFTSISLFAWYYLQDKWNYWSRRGLPYIPPLKGLLGTLHFILQRKSFSDVFNGHYWALEGHKYGGFYQMLTPGILLRDPEIIKAWLIKGFTNFHDRGPEPNEEFDKLSGNLFQLTGEKWRIVRHKLSPGFSSAKLKIMYQTLVDCARDLNAYLCGLCSENGESEIDIKELMGNYTMDVIAACAMGVKCNAIQDPNCEFKRIVRLMFQFDWRRTLFFLAQQIHPKLPEKLRMKPVPPEVEEFLRSVTRKAIAMKNKDGSCVRKDFLQILMNIRSSEVERMNGSLEADNLEALNEELQSSDDEGPVFTENLLVGVVGTFLSAGLEPVAATLTFCLYELALNPEIQEKVFQEIQTIRNKSSGEIKYEDIKKFHYVSQVVDETLRKYPVAGFLGRICTEPFKIPDSDIVVDKGVILSIPVQSLHHDPRFFPEPDKFDPERFSEENMDKIVPGSYLPFGEGPRFCIAQRLALMEVKTMVAMMVSNYSLHACAKTQKRLEFDKKFFTLSPKGAVRLKIKQRK